MTDSTVSLEEADQIVERLRNNEITDDDIQTVADALTSTGFVDDNVVDDDVVKSPPDTIITGSVTITDDSADETVTVDVNKVQNMYLSVLEELSVNHPDKIFDNISAIVDIVRNGKERLFVETAADSIGTAAFQAGTDKVIDHTDEVFALIDESSMIGTAREPLIQYVDMVALADQELVHQYIDELVEIVETQSTDAVGYAAEALYTMSTQKADELLEYADVFFDKANERPYDITSVLAAGILARIVVHKSDDTDLSVINGDRFVSLMNNMVTESDPEIAANAVYPPTMYIQLREDKAPELVESFIYGLQHDDSQVRINTAHGLLTVLGEHIHALDEVNDEKIESLNELLTDVATTEAYKEEHGDPQPTLGKFQQHLDDT